jgi:hypothetical protein
MKELLQKLNKINEESVQAQHDTTNAVLRQSGQLESLKRTTEESGKFTRITSLLASKQLNKINELNNTVLAGLTADQKNLLDQQRREKAAAQQRMIQTGLTGRARDNENRRFQNSFHKESIRTANTSRGLLEKSVGIASSQFTIRKFEIGKDIIRYNERRRLFQLQITRDRLLLSNVLAIREHLVGAITPEMAIAELGALQSLVKEVTMVDRNAYDRWIWRKELAQKELNDRTQREARDRRYTKERDQRKERIDNKNRRKAEINAEEAVQEQRNQNGKLLSALKKGGGLGMGGAAAAGKEKSGLFDSALWLTEAAKALGFTGTGAAAEAVRRKLTGKKDPDKGSNKGADKGSKKSPKAALPASDTGKKAPKGTPTARTPVKKVPAAGGLLRRFAILSGAYFGGEAALEEGKRLDELDPNMDELDKFIGMGDAFQKGFVSTAVGGTIDFLKEVAASMASKKEGMFPILNDEQTKKILDFSAEDAILDYMSDEEYDLFARKRSEVEELGRQRRARAMSVLRNIFSSDSYNRMNSFGGAPMPTFPAPPPTPSPAAIEKGDGALLMGGALMQTGASPTVVNNVITTDNSSITQNRSEVKHHSGPRVPIQTGSALSVSY